MNAIYSNGFVWWSEEEIEQRIAWVRILTSKIRSVFREINPAIGVFQVETPCLIPIVYSELPVYSVGENYMLRPESTSGTYEVMNQLRLKLPVCLYQVNKSFRDEKSDAMRIAKCRLREFWQAEYQLFYSPDTKAEYHSLFIEKFKIGVPGEVHRPLNDFPSYSNRTTDIEIGGVEVASISSREDYSVPVLEISFGLDRLLFLERQGK